MKKDKYKIRICRNKEDEYYIRRKKNRLFSFWKDLYVTYNGVKGRILDPKHIVLEFIDQYDVFNKKDIILEGKWYLYNRKNHRLKKDCGGIF